MKQDIKAQWIEALRSGKYTQGYPRLTTARPGGDFDCCLGVLCKVVGIPGREDGAGVKSYEGFRTALPSRLLPELDLDTESVALGIYDRDHVEISLAGANDSRCTFPQIADLIEYFL